MDIEFLELYAACLREEYANNRGEPRDSKAFLAFIGYCIKQIQPSDEAAKNEVITLANASNHLYVLKQAVSILIDGLILFVTDNRTRFSDQFLSGLLAQAKQTLPDKPSIYSLTGDGHLLGRNFHVVEYSAKDAIGALRGLRCSLAVVDTSGADSYGNFVEALKHRMPDPSLLFYVNPAKGTIHT